MQRRSKFPLPRREVNGDRAIGVGHGEVWPGVAIEIRSGNALGTVHGIRGLDERVANWKATGKRAEIREELGGGAEWQASLNEQPESGEQRATSTELFEKIMCFHDVRAALVPL
jgi:ERCC4-type nuclease